MHFQTGLLLGKYHTSDDQIAAASIETASVLFGFDLLTSEDRFWNLKHRHVPLFLFKKFSEGLPLVLNVISKISKRDFVFPTDLD
jgi:hypothetical protein